MGWDINQLEVRKSALKETGNLDNTLIIFMSDHGPAFCRGKLSCYEFGIKIPFVVFGEGFSQEGLISDKLVSTVDIMPTCLEIAQIKQPKPLAGRSFIPLIRGENVNWRKCLCCEYTTHTTYDDYYPTRSIRDQRYKLILNILKDNPRAIADSPSDLHRWQNTPKNSKTYKIYNNFFNHPTEIEFYDLKEDPYETKNLITDQTAINGPELNDVKKRLLNALTEWRKETADPFLEPKFLKKVW